MQKRRSYPACHHGGKEDDEIKHATFKFLLFKMRRGSFFNSHYIQPYLSEPELGCQ